jgi:hypothetical protein
LCFGRIGKFSNTRTPGVNATGNVRTTVNGSGAVAVSRFPPSVRLGTRTLPGASYAALIENTTSADVNGVPSENVTSGRSLSVCVRPSGESDQLSASAGSTRSVVRSTRTRRASVSRLTRSVGALASKYRL